MSKISLCVGYDRSLPEYRVEVRVDGKYNDGPSYYTTDETDAWETLFCMAREFEGKGHTVLVDSKIKRRTFTAED